jgi:hypothetical protein
VWQLERGNINEKLHWQIYIELYEPVSPDFLKQEIFGRMDTHVEEMKIYNGHTFEQTRTYCKEYCEVPEDDGANGGKKGGRVEGPQSEVGPHYYGEWLETDDTIHRFSVPHRKAAFRVASNAAIHDAYVTTADRIARFKRKHAGYVRNVMLQLYRDETPEGRRQMEKKYPDIQLLL